MREMFIDGAVLRLCFLFALGLLSVGQLAGAESIWAQDKSDVPADPAVTWGVLPNGLRYAIRPNAEPKGRISMRFVITAGSMHENDDERGLAHFLEHMAFRSTRDHPEGSLVATLQRMGIGFGPDNTAFTTHDYTIYHLELPDSKPATLREGLGVFREYADGITFSQHEIDRERGVVLSELATRNVPEAQAWQARMRALIPEARFNDRLPIGLETQIRGFQPAQFQAFYDAWYRPERMIVVLVGDVTAETAAPLIRELFGPLVARGEPRPEPPLTTDKSALATQSHLFKDARIIGASISLEHAARDTECPDSQASWKRDLEGALAFNMLQRRLSNMAMERGASFSTPMVNYGGNTPGWSISSLMLGSWAHTWRPALRDAEQELRRAEEFGFTAEELREAKTYYRTYYEQGVRSAATAPSDDIATAIATSIVYDRVYASINDIAALMLPWINDATLESCLAQFRRAWGAQPANVFIIANTASNVTDNAITALYAYSQRLELLPPEDRSKVEFAYTDFGPAGKLESDEHLDDLDLWLGRFKNGVRYNFKHTEFEKDTVLVSLRIGHGRLSQPKDEPGLDLLANYGFLAGGLGRHTNTEMSSILNGHVLGLNFKTESDAFIFSLQCAPREILLGLQILAAVLTDSAYRPEAVRAARAGFGSLYESLTNSPGGPIFATAPNLLAGGDKRFGVPDGDTLSERTMKELRAWMEAEFSHSPIEVSVVGDIDRDTATAAMARTLGALPARQITREQESDPSVTTPAPPGTPVNWPINPGLKQVALAYFWPVPTSPDAHTERRCHLVAGVLEERLRQRVREELGAAYSVTARFTTNEGFPSQNFIEAYAEVETSRADEADKIIRREVAAMQREGITADEFERTKQPFLAQRSVDLRHNGYWAFTVLAGAQDKPYKITAARDRTEDTASITQAEVQALIDRYLKPSTLHAFRTSPYQTQR